MNKLFTLSFLLLVFFSCSGFEKKKEFRNWKEESAHLAKEYAYAWGPLYPEYISDIGFETFDSMAAPFSKDLDVKRYELARSWKKRLEAFIESHHHPELVTDAKILLSNVELEMEDIKLAREKGIIPFMSISEFVFSHLKPLIKPESSRTKMQSALIRFRQYVRGSDNQPPLVEGYMSYMQDKMNRLAERRKRGIWPVKAEIIASLNESPEFLRATEELLKKWSGNEWKRDFEELKKQVETYENFIKKKVLPYAAKDPSVPREVYAYMLKGYGIFEDPDALIKTAREDYRKTYVEFRRLAAEIATSHKLKKNDPVFVMSYLESRKFSQDEELLNYYKFTADKLLEIVRANKLLTIKERPDFIIRFGTKAEMQSIPAPHFDSPSLTGEDKGPGQYIIPRITGKQGMRDFSFREAILNLTAHEGIPGHALQYQSMKERGITLIRAKFAFNSANVEGWAHYAEQIIYPYLTAEEKFVTLQRRLWRQARMFLDPELNLGKISLPGNQILNLYMNELGFSREFAQSELKRYAYIMPGQAPSYYYGAKIIENLKGKLKAKHATSFSEQCFNDALLEMGVLPLSEINDRLLRDFSCAR
ncbi:MAG: DUF885 domain-containing protein [Bacteriovoracia bacterium]